MLVAGVDSSTQSTKVVLCRAEDGAIVGTASAPHPDGTECDPTYWWQALGAAGEGLLEQASAIGVAAQQHGMVALDDAGEVIRPAILWNDMRAAPQTRDLIAELGGPAEWARRTGSVPARLLHGDQAALAGRTGAGIGAAAAPRRAAARLAHLAAGRGRAGHRPGGRLGHGLLLPRRRHAGCPISPRRRSGGRC